MSPKKKMGRPTDEPKRHEIKVRFDDRTIEILDRYCAEHDLKRTEGIRLAVRKLEEETK